MTSRPAAQLALRALLAFVLLIGGGAQASEFDTAIARADQARRSDPLRFRKLLDEAEAHRAQATPAGLDRLTLLHAYRQVLQGDFPAALANLERLSRPSVEPATQFKAALLSATVSATTRDWGAGLSHLHRALQLENQVKDPEERIRRLAVVSTIYLELGRHAEALQYANQAIARTKVPRTRCHLSVNRARALTALEARPGREELYTQARRTCVAASDPIGILFSELDHARYLAKTGERGRAIRMLDDAITRVESAGYNRLTAEIHAHAAKMKLESGDLTGAERAADTVLTLGGQTPSSEQTAMAHEVLYKVALARGETSRALRQLQLFHDAQQMVTSEVKAREYAYHLSRFQAETQAQAAALLRQRNRSLELERKLMVLREQRLRAVVLALALGLAGIVYATWHFRHSGRALKPASRIDALTGLATRAHLEQAARILLARSAEHRRLVGFVLIDLDLFRLINENCGHAVGDWMLREVGEALRAEAGPDAIVARMGGKVFAIVAEAPTIDVTRALAESVRARIGSIDPLAGGCYLRLSASIGITTTTRSGYDYERMLADADAAVRCAKAAGRNRTVASGLEVESPGPLIG